MESTSRYEVVLKLASGGMASVYVGYQRGALGFRQLVAIKRPHAHLLEDLEFKKSLLREAQLASKIRHANVVDVRDVDESEGSIDLVMDYVEGASLAQLASTARDAGKPISPRVAVRIALDASAGLHAAHDATDENGASLHVVHRDVSPQNILVGIDGVSRVADFGIAKCVRIDDASTQEGTLKGKLGYMAPEYLRGAAIDRRADLFAIGVVLWEALAGQRLFRGASEVETMSRVLETRVPALADVAPHAAALDPVLAQALAQSPDDRFSTLEAFATALELVARERDLVATPKEVGEFVRGAVGAQITERRARIRDLLGSRPSVVGPPPSERDTRPDRLQRPSHTATLSASISVSRDDESVKLPKSHAGLIVAVVAVAAGVAGVLAIVHSVRTSAPAPPSIATDPPTTPAPPPPAAAPGPTPSPIASEPPAPSPSTSASAASALSAPRAKPPPPAPTPKRPPPPKPIGPPDDPYGGIK